MNIPYATLHDVIGRPAIQDGYSIVPVVIEIEGNAFTPCFPLGEVDAARIPPILRPPVAHHYDVAWVRARLPAAFGIRPEPTEFEKSLLHTQFLAVPMGGSEGIAFECSDYYGETSLYFSPQETREELKRQVADAFWNALLAEPEELEDFSASVLHLGTPLILHFGCEDGEPYLREEET